MSRPSSIVTASLATLVVTGTAFAGEPVVERFFRISALPGDVGSTVTGVSGNGHRLVGTSFDADGNERGFWWTATAGVVPLRGTALDDRPLPFGVSRDGSVVTGGVAQGFEAIEGVWWTVPGGAAAQLMGEVDPLQPGSTIGLDMTPDGSIIVGIADACTCDLASQAFRYTLAGGIEGLGWLDEDFFPFYSRAHAISDDGTVIVGEGEVGIDDDMDGVEEDRHRVAMRYTDATGMTSLGDLDGGTIDSRAFDVSADGLVIVGSGTSADGPEAFMWTPGDHLVGLGDLPGGIFGSEARAVNADGTVIVGFGEGPNGGEAVVWIDGTIHALTDLLADAGYDLAAHGVALDSAVGVSDDGRTIVGRGTRGDHELGWVLRLAP